MAEITILIVEDDPHMLELLAIHIEGAGYQVIKAENGLTALAEIEKHPGQLNAIVSDVEMPELDGYELCQQVREIPDICEIPFVFVSAKTTLEEKLKGFEVGGDEYITKPVEAEELLVKLKHIIDNKIRHCDLNKQLEASRKAAMQAMGYSSHLGQVLEFMKATAGINSFEDLAQKIFDAGEVMGLLCIVQFHTPAGIVNYRKIGEVTPLEANVIEMSRNKGRIFDFQARTIFHYHDFSLLIMNMPLDDKEKYGLIKDVLGNFSDAIESRVKLLSTDAVVKQKQEIMKTVNSSLQSIGQSYRDVQDANMQAMDEMIQHMEEAMYGFGLSENQEDMVRSIVMFAKNKASEIFEDGKELYQDFENIHNVLLKGLK